MGGYIISDNSHIIPGDISKSFCSGADFVMASNIFEGHFESGGENIIDPVAGQFYKVYQSSDGKT